MTSTYRTNTKVIQSIAVSNFPIKDQLADIKFKSQLKKKHFKKIHHKVVLLTFLTNNNLITGMCTISKDI